MIPHELTVRPPWVEPFLGDLAALRSRNAHALLVHGQAGIGKRALAWGLARSLLCESDDPVRRANGGCSACPACLWFDQGSHPDFRRVVPEAVAAAEGADLADVDSDGTEATEASGAKGKKTPSREIKVDEIRALHAFMSVATHRGRARVVLIHPLEAVNDVAANALLKMLEEPPPETVFVLVADHLGRIPATIVSRCQKRFVATPPPEAAAAWLSEQRVDDAPAQLALAGGAPLAALAASRDTDALAAHRVFVGFLAKPGVEAALATAESFGRAPPAPLIRWMQQWLADCVEMRLAGRIRYHPTHSAVIARMAKAGRLDAMLALVQRLESLRRTIDHPLNTRLLLETLLIAYVDALVPE